MKRDPVCGMPGVMERHGQWFCSEHCAQEYARHRPASDAAQAGASSHIPVWRGFLDPWLWVPVSGLVLGTAGWWWPAASGASASYVTYLKKVAVPFFIGLLLGGAIEHFIPKAYIITLLSGPRKRVIVRSTLLGFLASACSHGCLALTVELYRKGASTSAAVSFLLASPWASLSLTLVLLGLFRLAGVVIVLGALGIAFATGLIFQRLERRGLVDVNPHGLAVHERFSIHKDLAARWRGYAWTPRQLAADARGVVAGTIPLGRMVMGWVQLGLVLSAVLGTVVPHHVFERFLGPSALGLALTLAAAALIEVCSEGTAPLAYELYRHTGALGNAFAFLMGGVVTDYTELAVVWTAIGRRTVGWFLAITLPLVVVIGWLLNRIVT